LTISSLSVVEGNSGQKQMLFGVQVKGAWNKNMKVDYEVMDGTATAGSDYVDGAGTLSFASAKRQMVSVWVNGDTEAENDENFTVALNNPVGATIKPGGGIGTITNDDLVPVLSVQNVVVGEGDTGTTPAVFEFALSNTSTAPVSFAYATADGSAAAPGDYEAASGIVTFEAGQRSQSVTVPVVGDTTNEGVESFSLVLSGAAGVNLPATAPTATIIDDEGAPAVSIADASVTEGDSGTVTASFDVVLSHASAATAEVDFATANGTASEPGDYTANSGRLTFAPGDLAETVSVEVKGDNRYETDEDFAVTLSSPSRQLGLRRGRFLAVLVSPLEPGGDRCLRHVRRQRPGRE
jgi:chitinase